MDSYREAQLMRILEKRRRRGVLGVFDDIAGADHPEFTEPPPRRRAGSVTAATQTRDALVEASTSPPPVSRGVQTSTSTLDAMMNPSPPTAAAPQPPVFSTSAGARHNADTTWRDDSRLDNSGISSILANTSNPVRGTGGTGGGGGGGGWRRDPSRAAPSSTRDPRYAPTSPEYAAVRYKSPTRVPSLMYSPSRSPGRAPSPLSSSPSRWRDPVSPTSYTVSVPRPLSPPRYSPSNNRDADAWHRGAGARSSPSRYVPMLSRRQSSPLRGGAIFATPSPVSQRSRRPAWLEPGDGFNSQPLARWRSASSRRWADDDHRRSSGGTGDWQQQRPYDGHGARHLVSPYEGDEGDLADRGFADRDRDNHSHHDRHHHNGVDKRRDGRHRRSKSHDRSGSGKRHKSREKERKKDKKHHRGKSKERRRGGKSKGTKHGLDPRLALTPLGGAAIGHSNMDDDGLDSYDHHESSSTATSRSSSSSSDSAASSSLSSTLSDRRERRRRRAREKEKRRGKKRQGTREKKDKKRRPPTVAPFPPGKSGAARGGGRPAGSIIPLAAGNAYAGGSPSFRQSVFSATRTNVSQSQHVNPNDQIGIPDVRSTIDLKTSAQVLHAGDWFYKWNRAGTEVHPRWVWVDLRSYLLVWSHRETRDPNFSGSLKLENISQIMPSELVQADEEGLPKTYYVLMIETPTRVLQLATERRNKVDVWFEALNNIVAFVRRRDIAKGTQIPD